MTKETDYQQKYQQARAALQSWLDQQEHNRCWYYPDIFNTLAKILEVEAQKDPQLPPLDEFRRGCERYQEEEYEKSDGCE